MWVSTCVSLGSLYIYHCIYYIMLPVCSSDRVRGGPIIIEGQLKSLSPTIIPTELNGLLPS